jgi:hypothetical protein
MNISWSDLNNVQEPGEYPFRDGTINVTFSELATWKKNPNVQFRLMRVHPIQGLFKYVLGQQETLAAPDNKLIYESSNGDSWWLNRDPVAGGQAVLHRPNPQSGGHVSTIEIEKFLSAKANGPEHQALRQLLETRPAAATILIAYDLHTPQGEAYGKLIDAIRSLGTWWHHLETVWIVQCYHKPIEIRDQLQPHIRIGDQLLVVDISGDETDSFGVNKPGTEWLRANR